MARFRMAPWLLVLWLLAPTTPAQEAPATGEETPASVPNPSFEDADGERPQDWSPSRWGGEGRFTYADVGRSGGRSVRIDSGAGADVGWSARVPVRLRSRYRLSGWIRTQDVRTQGGARGALFNLHDLQPVATPALTGTQDWTRVEVEFDTGMHDSVQINCLFGGWGLATGTAWYDDLELTLLSAEEWDPVARIDATREGEPISPYVYGQFIEHLGRCIQGGIWAEMLEDRKFFHPVGGEASPWRTVGEVTMDREAPFVGEHTPRLGPGPEGPAGLIQDGLGLVAGKTYVGRIWLAGDPQGGPVDVSLVWGDAPDQRQTVRVRDVDAEWRRSPLSFLAPVDADEARLEVTARGQGSVRVGTLSLMPGDHVQGMRADTLALLQELDSPVYRWPGGNFVSGYDWKDGIGERDRRPPRKNPAWQGVESNDFGLDEFLAFCRTLDTEPYIAVNSGLGGVASAREELQYANGPADSPMGAWRARNGHPERYGVRFWGIGNEMYGGWQLGHVPLEEYLPRHNAFAEALRAEDPSVQLVGVGAVGAWSEGMLRHCAGHMDLLSEHFYRQEGSGLAGHVHQIPESVRGIAEAHRAYRQRLDSLHGRDIRIALDEWNYWYGPHVYGELGTRYFLKDALGIAAGLHEIARQSDLYFMANYAQTVNVIGAIKTSRTHAAFATTGLVLKLYRREFGTLPVHVQSPLPLDVMAAFTEDRRTLTVGVVNPTLEALDLPVELRGVRLRGDGTAFTIAGDDPMACNEPGQEPRVRIQESAVEGIADHLSVPACSVTLFRLAVQEPTPAPMPAKPLPLAAVRLTGGPLKHAQDLTAEYLLRLEPDRMLAPYRALAGLEPRAEGYGGWDGPGRNLTGHIAGHHLSAVSLMYAATGDERFRERARYLVRELRQVQEAHGDGFVGALEGVRECMAAVATGDIRSSGFDLNGLWSPWYTLHKTFAGLRDAWRHTGDRTALEIEVGFAEWAARHLEPMDDTDVQRMLNTEFGGMNEVLVDLSVDTGDRRWMDLSYRFEHDAIVGPLKQERDILAGTHGNTQVPKLIGSAARYAATGNAADGVAARFFWDQVAHHHSYATGGHGQDEYFGPPDQLTHRVRGRTAETCNVYNMAKLTRTLFALDPREEYAAFLERCLFNHILGSIDPETGATCYMVPVGQGVRREYADLFQSFTCCVGSGMESHALHGDGIYHTAEDRLWVNLYAPSTARWEEQGATLTMDTDFPVGTNGTTSHATATLALERPRAFTLALRRPAWAGEGFQVAVNGTSIEVLPPPGSSVEMRRTWQDGDRVTLVLPLRLRQEPLPDDPRRVALMWGPLVLAADLDQGRPEGAREEHDPAWDAPVFVAAERPTEEWLLPCPGPPGAFQTYLVGMPRDLVLRPFHALHRCRQATYFDLFTPEEWTAEAEARRAEQRHRARVERATVAYFQPGEMQPERDFHFEGERTRPVRVDGTAGRIARGGWFSVRMPVAADAPMALLITCFSGHERRWARQAFTLRVDGEVLAEVTNAPEDPPRFFDLRYEIPEEWTAGKAEVTVRFEAAEGAQAGGVFGVRMVR